MDHYLNVKREVLRLFDFDKDLEVRVASKFFRSIRIGDRICFNNYLWRRVVGIRRYSTLENIVRRENIERLAPGATREKALAILQRIYPRHKEWSFLVFELTE